MISLIYSSLIYFLFYFTENQNDVTFQSSSNKETEDKVKTLLSCSAEDMKAKAIYYGILK